MKTYLSTIVAAAFVAVVGAPASAEQVKASPGVTLTEAAQAKFNRDTGGSDDRHVAPIAGSSEPTRQFYASAGLTVGEGRAMGLEQAFVAKVNRESGGDDDQLVVVGESISMGSRAYGSGGDHGQLATSAGLSAAEASAMSLADIAAAKFAAEGNHDY
jgi:hypothetical protein